MQKCALREIWKVYVNVTCSVYGGGMRVTVSVVCPDPLCKHLVFTLKPTVNESTNFISIVCVSQLICLLPLSHRAPLLSKKLISEPHCCAVTCSFITVNTHTVLYFDLIPHTPSCCPKYSLDHQMWIHLSQQMHYFLLFV